MLTDLAYYDITPTITEKMAVFPGDKPYRRDITLDFKRGDNLGLSSVEMSVHTGAHVDAPNHYHAAGVGIDERCITRYFGPCQVIAITRALKQERLTIADLEGKTIQAKRILFHTGSYPDPYCWQGDFVGLSPELVEYLANLGVELIGIDTPSVDPADDAELLSHQAIYRHDLAILEGVVLDSVPEGLYILSALPLRLSGADASPVRAVLFSKASLSHYLDDPWK